MDGFTQHELDQEETLVREYEEAFEFYLAEGCTEQEADQFAERRAHLAICDDCAREYHPDDEGTPRMSDEAARRLDAPPF